MYLVMDRLPEELIDIDAGLIKFWTLRSPSRLAGLDIYTHDEELGHSFTLRTGLNVKTIERQLPNWYLDSILLVRPKTIYIVRRTSSILDL